MKTLKNFILESSTVNERLSPQDKKEKIYADVHYYDAKGRQYRLNNLAEDLRNAGIEVVGTGFEDDYDGYVEIKMDFEQYMELSKKYGSKLVLQGNLRQKGDTDEEVFANALKVDRMVRR